MYQPVERLNRPIRPVAEQIITKPESPSSMFTKSTEDSYTAFNRGRGVNKFSPTYNSQRFASNPHDNIGYIGTYGRPPNEPIRKPQFIPPIALSTGEHIMMHRANYARN